MGRALDGFVVLDLTTDLWAALGAAILADFGARVIRVEDLGAAHGCRRSTGDGPAPPEWDHRHELANRNKLGLAVALDSEPGREILRGLVGKADAILTDRPRAELEGLGLDADTVVALKPDVVYGRGTGFGPSGPDRDLPALDELAAARTGMMRLLPQPGKPPVYAGHGQTYASVMLALGVATALFHRQRTGEGQVVDASLLGGNMYAASLDLQAYLAIGGERLLQPVSRLDAGNPMSGTLYRTSDDRWVALTMPETDRWWPALAEVTGIDAKDPRFDSHEKRCETSRLELIALLDERLRRQSADHWRSVFAERQMSADVIEEYSYPARDPQARRNRYILDLEDLSLGRVSLLGFPISMSETPARLRRVAPRLGQHTAEVLHDVLGYAEERIVELEAAEVIA